MPMGILGNQLQFFSIPKIDLFTYSKHSDIITSFIFERSIGIFKIKIKTDYSKRTSWRCSNITGPIFLIMLPLIVWHLRLGLYDKRKLNIASERIYIITYSLWMWLVFQNQ